MIAVQEREPVHYTELRSLLEDIVSVIAKKTVDPAIEHIPDKAIFLLAVDPHDQGRFIGKNGQTIWSIQTIFWYAGFTLCRHPYSVKLLDQDQPIYARPVPVKFNKAWDRKKIENLVARVLGQTLRSYCRAELLETGETSMTITLTIEKYLALPLAEPNYVEAFGTLLKVAGMSQGANIKTEAIYA